MAHDVAGSGPPMLLLHSGVCDRRMWEPQWAELTQSFRVVRPDLRGFGETALPVERFSSAADIVELLDCLDMQEVRVVGSSFGGRVALEFAATAPERMSRLILLCSALPGFPSTPDADAFGEAEDALLESGNVHGAVELNVATWLGPEADDATRELMRVMQRRAFEVQLAAEQGSVQPEMVEIAVKPEQIRVPTLAVSGGKDLDLFGAVAAHLADTIQDASHVALDWAGHLPSMERPPVVTRLIVDFSR